MNTIKKTALGTIVAVGLVFGAIEAAKAVIWCPYVFDVARMDLFIEQSTVRGQIAGAKEAIAENKKEELKIWETRKRFKKKDFPKASFYKYMKSATATGSEEYLPAQTDGVDSDSKSSVNASSQEDYIREKFFYDSDDSKVTEEEKQRVSNLRLSYLESLAKEVLSLSVGARDSIAGELRSLNQAKTTAGGLIQQVDLLVHNKKLMIEQKAADILLQAKLLELDSAQLLLGLHPQRMKDPNESDSSSGGTD